MQLLTKHKKSTKHYIKAITIVFSVLLILGSTSSCSKKEIPVINTNEILVINGVAVSKPEIMIYVYQVVDEFQKIGGDNVWEFEDFSGGKSAIEVAKEAVLENIIRMKVINRKARELGIVLTPEQEEESKQKAEEYFESMKEGYIQNHNITLSIMKNVFMEFALTNNVIANVTSDFVPAEEIVQARMNENVEYNRVRQVDRTLLLTEIQAQHILIETRVKESSGTYVMLTPDEKEIKYNLAETIYQKAIEGVSFDELLIEFSEEEMNDQNQSIDHSITNPSKKIVGNYFFSKGLLSQTAFAALIELQEGDISPIIEDETGYHIFKIKSVIFPTEERIQEFEDEFKLFEDELRKTLEKEVIQESFESLYKQWKQVVEVTLDKEQWNKISLQN
jgi:foldase protein PrsA